jgi:DNA-binding transcriptional LysR family regulator
MKVDLNLLPIALALYDELSVSRTAQKLGMSQPAVSMALRKLRVAFGDPLFIRAAKGITPTPRAHALVRAARPLLTRLQESVLAEEHFNPGVSTRPFTFALSDVGEMVFLPKLLERLRAQAPDAWIHSVSMPPHLIAQGLENGEIDLAIGYFPDLNRTVSISSVCSRTRLRAYCVRSIRSAPSGFRWKIFWRWTTQWCVPKAEARRSSSDFSSARRSAERSPC